MSRKEAPRVGLLNAVVAGRIRTREVAEALRVSERQVRRLRLGLRWVQLPPGPRRSWAGLRVELRELLDGRLVVLHDQRVLASQRSPGPGFVLRPRPLPRGTRRSRRPVHPPDDVRAAAAAHPRGHLPSHPDERDPSLAPRRHPAQPHPAARVAAADIFTEQLTRTLSLDSDKPKPCAVRAHFACPSGGR